MVQPPTPLATVSHSAAERWKINPADLDLPLAPAQLGFQTTEELEPLDHVFGQERAMKALDLGLAVQHRGYNVYVSGMTGAGRKQLIRRLLETRARQEPTPNDWVYVFNFDAPDRPLALNLPSGQGGKLRHALEQVIERLRLDLPIALKTKDFDTERDRLAKTFGEQSEALFATLTRHAAELNMLIRRMPDGTLHFLPIQGEKLLSREEIANLGDKERADVEHRQQELTGMAEDLLSKQQDMQHEMRQEIERIIRALAQRIVEPLFLRIKVDHSGLQLAQWLDQAQAHLLDNLDRLQNNHDEEGTDLPSTLRAILKREDPWLEYRVNVVADHTQTQGAPVVVETSPTYRNLFGTIEHSVNLFGRVSTSFMHIKPGSLLRANGGYIIFDMGDAVTEPLVWKQLKRTLKSGQLLTDVYEPFSLLSSAELKPYPIPINAKVVVIGTPDLYYTLSFMDEEFGELFKVRADFAPETARTEATEQAYARFVAKQVRAEGLPPFDAGAVVEVIRFGTREAAHQGKVSVELGAVADIIREAGYWARQAGAVTVAAPHVRQALEERVYRSDRIAAKVRELIDEGTLKVSLEGSQVGQVNGLSVWDLGDYRFGRPCRVTAAVGIGQDGLVNIERESDLSGSTHDKGVLILEGYLRSRYARAHPLALTASLAFEQSYGLIDGDSASSAELYCLLSALGEIPLRQDLAVTGSVNQRGEVQAVGGVNEKIEGFFDVCRGKGLTGTQGVCIPRANVRHLVLRHDVLDALHAGQFHLWAIDTVEEGIELLTGIPAGDVNTEGTFHFLLDQRLQDILTVLGEQTAPAAAPHVRTGSNTPPKPSPPPLPGERG